MALLSRSVPAGLFGASCWAFVWMMSAGCTVQRDVGHFPDIDAALMDDVGVQIDVGTVVQADPTLEDPDGWWLVFVQDRQCIYGVGDPLENVVWSTYVFQLRRDRAGAAFIRQRVRMCLHELSPLQFGFLTVVGPEIPDAQPTHDVAGFLLASAPGSAYVTDEVIDNWGLEGLAADERLPDDDDDPRIVDQDGDGLPGVTVSVTTPEGFPLCSVRMIERIRVGLDGAVVDGRHVSGRLLAQIEQRILSTDADLCSGGDLTASLGQTRFDMVRVDGKQGGPNLDANRDGEVDCVEVRAGLESTLTFYGLSRLEPDSLTHCP